jgi:chromosome segregation ATPase
MPEQQDKGIIKELIAHINSLEDKIKLLSDTIAETEDLVTVNKLDIVNMKNGLEKLKISMPEVSPDTINKLRELESITENIGQVDKWKNIEKEIEALKSQPKSGKVRGINEVIAGMEFMGQRIEKLEAELGKVRSAKPKAAVSDLSKRIESVEKKTSLIKHCPSCNAIVNRKAAFCSKCGKPVG